MIINWSEFLQKVEKISCLWVGETHGIAKNYKAYKLLIGKLMPLGFNTIALEMPEDLENFSRKNFLKYAHYFDGRFSKESLNFFEWLENLEGIRILCFDVRTPKATQQEDEEQMARNLLSKIGKKEKVLVLSGSFHSGTDKQQTVLPMAGIVKEKIEENLVAMEFKYQKGHFYNFGMRKFTKKFHHFDSKNLSFGKITLDQNGDTKYFFHCSRSVPVTLLKETIKKRLKDLFEQDQEDRKNWKWDNPIFLKEVRKKDKDKRTEVEWLLAQAKELDGENYYHAL